MGPRAGLDGCEISRPHRDSIPDRPARSSVLTANYDTKNCGFIIVNLLINHTGLVAKMQMQGRAPLLEGFNVKVQ